MSLVNYPIELMFCNRLGIVVHSYKLISLEYKLIDLNLEIPFLIFYINLNEPKLINKSR